MKIGSNNFSLKALRQQSLRALDRVVDTVREPIDRFVDTKPGTVVKDGLLGAIPFAGAGSNLRQLMDTSGNVDLDVHGVTRTMLAFTGVSASMLATASLMGGRVGPALAYSAISMGTAVINSITENVLR